MDNNKENIEYYNNSTITHTTTVSTEEYVTCYSTGTKIEMEYFKTDEEIEDNNTETITAETDYWTEDTNTE